ncbi:MAG: FtsX-like permease family protein [Chloroflexota bacterium]
MNVIYQKIWADIWGNKSRTIQVALVIALGAFGAGLVVGGRNLIVNAINADWQKAGPPTISLIVNPPMTDDQLLGLKNVNGVVEVEGLSNTIIEWRPSEDAEWESAFLRARSDYFDQIMSKDFLYDGKWPEGREVAISRGSDITFDMAIGDTVQLRVNGREREIQVDGIIKSVRAAPFFTGNPDFFVTRARYLELVGNANYETILISMGDFNQERAEVIDAEIKERLDKLGIDSQGANQPLQARIADPETQPASAILDVLFSVMGVVGSVVLFLAVFLVFNSVSAIITQQIDQIGVMKAIGARGRQILWGYLLLIFVYSLLAVTISIPLSAIAANGIKKFFLDFTNTTNTGFAFESVSILAQIFVAVIIPLIAATVPLLRGVRITVREAISTYGLSGSVGVGFVDRLIAGARNVPYSILLTLGNMFRNTQRVFLIQLTLVGSGLIFMVVMGVSDSTQYTFEDQLKTIHKYQVAIAFQEPQRTARVEQQVSEQIAVDPEIAATVTNVEFWTTGGVSVRPVTQLEVDSNDRRGVVLGVPETSNVYAPEVVDGRWLQPNDYGRESGSEPANVLVLHKALAAKLEIGVGDEIVLTRDGEKDSVWQIVGLFFDPVVNSSMYMPREALAQFLGTVNKTNAVWVQTTTTDDETHKQIATSMEAYFEDLNIAISPETVYNGNTIGDIVFSKLFFFSLLISLLAIMAVVIAAVGGIGLSGVLSLNVLERTREIGVMRAIGASTTQISRLFIGEGLILGIMSWVIALPFSIPAGYFLVQTLGAIQDQEITYQFTLFGPLLWLAVISILAILASWFPARGATRVSVRESLAYQ